MPAKKFKNVRLPELTPVGVDQYCDALLHAGLPSVYFSGGPLTRHTVLPRSSATSKAPR
jgi:hypothetical protein